MYENHRLIKAASVAAITVAGLLIVLKYIGWIWTDSLGIQASLIDSILDIIASIINFFVIRHALRPADADHRFGHGKAEALGGLAQTLFIAGSAVWLLLEAGTRLTQPHSITNLGSAQWIIIIAIVLTSGLVAFQRYVIKRTRSVAITADSLHYQTDLLTNAGVFGGLYLSAYFNTPWIDTVMGVLIAGYILVTSYKIGRQSFDILMDKELDNKSREQILSNVYKHPEVLGIHDLRTRSTGQQIFIQMHVDLDEGLSLKQAYNIGFNIAKELKSIFPNADIIIHKDPIKR